MKFSQFCFLILVGFYNISYANIQQNINETINEKNSNLSSKLATQQNLQLSYSDALNKSQNSRLAGNNVLKEITDLSSKKLISFSILHTSLEDLEEGLMSFYELDRLKSNARGEYITNCKILKEHPNPFDYYGGNRGICENRERIDFIEICYKAAICNYEFLSQYDNLQEKMRRSEAEFRSIQIETERAKASLDNTSNEIAILRLQISNLKNLADQFSSLQYFANIKKIFSNQLSQFTVLENFFLNNDHNSAIDILNSMNSSYEKLLKTQSNNRVINQINISKQFNALLINNLKMETADVKYYTDNLSKMKTNYTEILKISADEFSRQYVATVENINGFNDGNIRNRFLDELEKINTFYNIEN